MALSRPRTRRVRLLLLVVGIALAAGVALRAAAPLRGYTDAVSYAAGDSVRVSLDGGLWPHTQRVVVSRASGGSVDTVEAVVRWQRTGPQPWHDGFGWKESASFPAPQASGLYLIENRVPFVVRPGGQDSLDVLVVYPSNTVAAYAQEGGRSLYVMNRWARLRVAAGRVLMLRWKNALPDRDENRARRVSFERPSGKTQWHFFESFLGWMARQPFVTGYAADRDLDDPRTLAHTRVLLVMGHSEYWTRRARRNVDAFVARGGHLVVLSGNTMWWQVRYDERGRLVCYKVATEDPIGADSLRTVTWDEPELDYPIEASIGAGFPHGGFGRDLSPGFRLIGGGALFEGLPVPADSIYDGPATEMDGAPLLAGEPNSLVADTARLGFHRFRLLGYQRGERLGRPTVGTMHAFQKTPTSGWVFQAGSTDWAGATFSGPDSAEARALTHRVLRLLVAGKPLL